MEVEHLLPIGSIVLLKGGKKRVMIFGVKQIDSEGENVEYDYSAVIYPEGNMGLQTQFLFNHTDIDRVYFKGFEDIERQNFIKNLTTVLEKQKKEKDAV